MKKPPEIILQSVDESLYVRDLCEGMKDMQAQLGNLDQCEMNEETNKDEMGKRKGNEQDIELEIVEDKGMEEVSEDQKIKQK